MSFIKKIDSDSLLVTRRLVIVIALITLSFLVISSLILKPKPPKLESFAKSKKVEDIQKALHWHFINNPGVFLTDDLTCSAEITKIKDTPSISVQCPGLFLKKQTTLTPEQISKVNFLIKNNANYWGEFQGDDNSSLKFNFPAFNFELKDVTSISTTQGLLGEEVKAKVIISILGPATSLNSILDEIYPEKLLAKIKAESRLPEKTEIETLITFRDNRYGYYLPINPTIK